MADPAKFATRFPGPPSDADRCCPVANGSDFNDCCCGGTGRDGGSSAMCPCCNLRSDNRRRARREKPQEPGTATIAGSCCGG